MEMSTREPMGESLLLYAEQGLEDTQYARDWVGLVTASSTSSRGAWWLPHICLGTSPRQHPRKWPQWAHGGGSGCCCGRPLPELWTPRGTQLPCGHVWGLQAHLCSWGTPTPHPCCCCRDSCQEIDRSRHPLKQLSFSSFNCYIATWFIKHGKAKESC